MLSKNSFQRGTFRAGQKRFWLAVFAAAPASLWSGHTLADSNWISASGGFYLDPTNWSNGVPNGDVNSSTNNAFFGPSGPAYTVTLSNAASVQAMNVGSNSTVVFELGGSTYSGATAVLGGNGSLTVQDGLFNFTNGGGQIQIGVNTNGFFGQNSGTVDASTIQIGGTGGNGTYSLTGGSLLVSGSIVLAGANSVFFQGAATNSAASLYVGSGGAGKYTVSSGASLLISGTEFVGSGGTGTITQTSGCNVASSLVMVTANASKGIYTLSGGLLQLNQSEMIGVAGGATFTQSGGSNTAPVIYVGSNTLGTVYNMTGGSLIATNGAGGGSEIFTSAIFTQANATNTGANLTVGTFSGNGSYTLSGSSVLTMTNSETIGTGGSVTFTQSGGTNSTNSFSLGGGTSGTSTYSMNGTAAVLTAASESILSQGRGAAFNQSAGTNTTPSLDVGVGFGTTRSTYTLTLHGVLNVTGTESIGDLGQGTFTQANGTNNAGSLYIGAASSNSGGIFDLANGALNVTGTETNYGFLGQTGGTNTCAIFDAEAGSTYNLTGGVLNAGQIILNGGTVVLNAGTMRATGTNGITVGNGGSIHGGGTMSSQTTLNSASISPGDPAIQTYLAGINFSQSATYDWQIAASLKDNMTGTPGTDFDQVQVTGGNLLLNTASLGGASMNVNLTALAVGDLPGGANNNSFWKTSHIWSALQVSGSGSNVGSANFRYIGNASYSTGNFASQLNADGKSIDVVYNEMNVLTGGANNTLIGTITLTGSPHSGSAAAGGITSGSFDIAGTSTNDTAISVLMDVKGSALAINQWYSEMRGAQFDGQSPFYAILQTGSGGASVPSWGNVPVGDEGFLLTFSNSSTAGSGDPYLNFDWNAGNGGVTLDQVFVAPEPSVMGFIAFWLAAMMKRRRRRVSSDRA